MDVKHNVITSCMFMDCKRVNNNGEMACYGNLGQVAAGHLMKKGYVSKFRLGCQVRLKCSVKLWSRNHQGVLMGRDWWRHIQAQPTYRVGRAGLRHSRPQPAQLVNLTGLSRAGLVFLITFPYIYFIFLEQIQTQLRVKYIQAGLCRALGLLQLNLSLVHLAISSNFKAQAWPKSGWALTPLEIMGYHLSCSYFICSCFNMMKILHVYRHLGENGFSIIGGSKWNPAIK